MHYDDRIIESVIGSELLFVHTLSSAGGAAHSCEDNPHSYQFVHLDNPLKVVASGRFLVRGARRVWSLLCTG